MDKIALIACSSYLGVGINFMIDKRRSNTEYINELKRLDRLNNDKKLSETIDNSINDNYNLFQGSELVDIIAWPLRKPSYNRYINSSWLSIGILHTYHKAVDN